MTAEPSPEPLGAATNGMPQQLNLRPVRGRLIIVGCAAVGLLGGLTVAVNSQLGAVQRFDLAGHQWALDHRTEASIALARGFSVLGGSRVTVPVLVVVGCLAPRAPASRLSRLGAGAAVGGAAVLGSAVGILLNRSVDRARPPVADWVGPASGGSFPSAHTVSASLFAAGCAWALLTRARPTTSSPRVPMAIRLATLAAVAVGVGWSRVWLGVHWPSDVLGGWTYALAWSALAATLAVSVLRARGGPAAALPVGEVGSGLVADTGRPQ